MALAEFDLIARYFRQQQHFNVANRLGVGDDCALLDIPQGYELAVTVDTMVENVHFFADADPRQLGHKILAVNLSDLAAMGAKPLAVTLALTTPSIDESWVKAFSQGFLQLAQRYNVDLIGGDTTTGPLTLTVQAMGLVLKEQALTRSRACAGDLIYVSGNIGDAGLGLKIKQGYHSAKPEQALQRFHTPEPRIELGLALNGLASACIDISDGLLADLGHVLQQSQVGAELDWDKIPLSPAVREYIDATQDWHMPLSAGDDYELCFTVPEAQTESLGTGCHFIGRITDDPGIRLTKAGKTQQIQAKGFEHFS